MLTCPNGPSRQAFAGQSHCRTGTLFYPLSCRIARKQLASAREDIHNRLSRESEVPLTAIHFLITTQAKRNLSSRSGIGGVLSAT